VRAVLSAGYTVVPVPGASALLAALVGSGLPPVPFTFFGFLPRSGGARRSALELLVAAPCTVVAYESPNRLARLLTDLLECGAGDRRAVVARELTKVHEEFRRGTVRDLAAYYAEHPLVRGEVVVVLEGSVQAPAEPITAEALAQTLLEDGLSASEAARELARRLQVRRNQAYQIVQSVSAKQEKVQ
jgi:16S rRNA (cytidine1402-2'-O)-methyltransferase